MTAGLWALKRLTSGLMQRPGAPHIALAAGLAEAARAARVSLQINAFGSVLTPFFTASPVRDYDSALAANTMAYCVLQGNAGARHLSAAVAVRGVVSVSGAYRRTCAADN